MGKLDGKVALITGAGVGIGRTIALLFSKEGAKVAVAHRNSLGDKETDKAIREAGGEAIFIKADVSKSADVERTVKTTVDAYGRLDILVNNAGIDQPLVPTADITEEEFDRVMDVNLKGVFLCSKYAIPAMLKQGGGGIINISSLGGINGWIWLGAYCASKAGVVMLTKTMAIEYGKHNLRVNCICPGLIYTPMAETRMPSDPELLQALLKMAQTPLGRIGMPEDVAQAALYLASEDSSFVTGSVLVVDGGRSSGISIQ